MEQGRDPIERLRARQRLPAQTVEDAPFVLVEPMRRLAPIVLASPHSGRRYPGDLLDRAHAPLSSLRRSEDAYVDELFAGAAGAGAPMLIAAVARAYVDLNRDPTDLDYAMYLDPPRRSSSAANSARVRAGLGVIPKICGDGREIYTARMPFADAERRLAFVYAPYHATLRALIEETHQAFGCSLLLDCHSMPSSARGPGAPDIVLGDRYGHACAPGITHFVEMALKRLGYRVARNAPFAGGHTTQIHGRPVHRRHALQIEINRGLYLDERSMARTAGFERVRADMTRLVEALCAARLQERLAAT